MAAKRRDGNSRGIQTALASIALIAAIVVGSVAAVHWLTGIPAGDLTADPASVEQYPTYVGYLSYAGVLLWAAAAVVCLFSAWQLRVRGGSASEMWFLALSGVVSGWLTLDDLFMLHEEVFPTYLGLSEPLVYAVYAVAGTAYLLGFRRRILEHEFWLLGMGLAFIGLSVFVDVVPIPGIGPYFVEDAAKFVGVLTWFVYFLRAASRAFQESEPGRGAPSASE